MEKNYFNGALRPRNVSSFISRALSLSIVVTVVVVVVVSRSLVKTLDAVSYARRAWLRAVA
jgi:hypothetical protein